MPAVWVDRRDFIRDIVTGPRPLIMFLRNKELVVKINVGFVGYGNFAPAILPYFQARPDVNKVALAELVPGWQTRLPRRPHGLFGREDCPDC